MMCALKIRQSVSWPWKLDRVERACPATTSTSAPVHVSASCTVVAEETEITLSPKRRASRCVAQIAPRDLRS